MRSLSFGGSGADVTAASAAVCAGGAAAGATGGGDALVSPAVVLRCWSGSRRSAILAYSLVVLRAVLSRLALSAATSASCSLIWRMAAIVFSMPLVGRGAWNG